MKKERKKEINIERHIHSLIKHLVPQLKVESSNLFLISKPTCKSHLDKLYFS